MTTTKPLKDRTGGYSKAQLDTFSPQRLWTELGLHRGALEEGQYYFIGSSTELGCISGQYRMISHIAHVTQFPWARTLGKLDARAELEGPVLGPNVHADVADQFVAYVTPMCKYLNSDHAPAPLKGVIAPEDRPDVGRTAKPRIAAKPKFRLPIRRTA